jgi:hypothetical protein
VHCGGCGNARIEYLVVVVRAEILRLLTSGHAWVLGSLTDGVDGTGDEKELQVSFDSDMVLASVISLRLG